MDFLNKAFAQLTDLFRSMTPAARITTGLLLAVVVISLGYLFRYQVSGPDEFLMSGEPIPASLMEQMKQAFAKANLNSYSIEGTSIRVPRAERAAYNAALADAKVLPPNFGSALEKAVSGGNVFESPIQREHRIKLGLQEELSGIIRLMKGIENAYVLYDTDTKAGFGREKTVTASVAVKGTSQLNDEQVSSIRHMVANSIAGLKPENVTVADLNGRVYYGDPEGGGVSSENLYRTVKQMHERDLRAKILNALSKIPDLTVEVSVQLDPLKSSQTDSVEHKPKPVTYQITDESKTRTRDGGGAGGAVGARAQVNTPTSLAGASTKSVGENEEESKRKELSIPSTEHVVKESVGLTPKTARASVGIPSGYFAKVWRERNPAKEGEEPKKPEQAALDQIRTEVSAEIQKHVAGLLPTQEGATVSADQVTITTFQDIQLGEIPVPGMSQNAIAWLGQHWSTLGIGGLAVFSLVMLRSMVRGGPSEPESGPAPLRIAAETRANEKQEESAEIKADRRLRRMSGSGPSLRDELSDLVKEDPDAAANILRAWIGQVG